MGIANLSSLIRAFRTFSPLSTWSGGTIAVDVSISAYRDFSSSLASVRRETPPHQDIDMEMVKTRLRQKTLEFYSVFKEENVDVIAVFDGPPPEEKSKVVDRRSSAKREMKARYEAAQADGDLATMLKNINWMIQLRDEFKEILQETIESLGFRTLTADEEAECTCSRMFHRGEVIAVFSQDTDVLAYRVETMICGDPIWIGQERFVGVYRLSEILDGLGLTPQQWVDLCIMCGCDYNERIPLIGPKRAYRHILAHGTIEEVLAHLGKDGSCLNHQRCRELFSL